MLDLRINPKNYPVNRVLRLFRAENENVRRTVRFANIKKLTSSKSGESTIFDSSNPHRKYVRCNKGDVVCSLNETQSVFIFYIEFEGTNYEV